MDYIKMLMEMDSEKIASLLKGAGLKLTTEEVNELKKKLKNMSNDDLTKQINMLKSKKISKEDLLNQIKNKWLG